MLDPFVVRLYKSCLLLFLGPVRRWLVFLGGAFDDCISDVVKDLFTIYVLSSFVYDSAISTILGR